MFALFAFVPSVKAGTLTVGTYGYWDANGDYHASSTPIQSAIDAASPGDTIVIVGSVYTENVVVDKNVTIRGATNPTIRPLNSSRPTITVSAQYATLRDLRVEGNSAFMLNSSDVVLINNTAIGGEYGFTLQLLAYRSRLENNTAVNCSVFGFGTISVNNTFVGNRATGCNEGFHIGMSGNYLANNFASGCNRSFYVSSDVLFAANQTFINNTAIGGEYGFVLSTIYCLDSRFENNTAVNCSASGFHTVSSSNTFVGNRATGCNEGFHIGMSGNYLANNFASGCNRSFYVSSDVLFAANQTFINNTAIGGEYGFVLSTIYCLDSRFENNTAVNCSASGFHTVSSSNTFVGNRATGCNEGFSIYNSSGSVLRGNLAANNSRLGILLCNSFNNTLLENCASGNLLGGIVLVGSANNTIEWNDLINPFNAIEDLPNSWDWNYYSDYVGWDRDGDGAGDVPYPILGGCSQDFHPRVCDEAPPEVLLMSPQNNSMNMGVGSISIRYYDQTSNVNASLCRLIVDNFEKGDASFTTSWMNYSMSFAEGTHQVAVYLEDFYGNWIWCNWSFVVDLTPPSIKLTSPDNNTAQNDGSVLIMAEYSDALSGVSVSSFRIFVDGVDVSSHAVAKHTYAYYVPVTPLADGPHNATVHISDRAGNSNSSRVYFTVDTTPPSLSVISPSNSTYSNSYVQFNASASDSLSSVDAVVAEVDGSYNVTLSPSGSGKYSGGLSLPDGRHKVVFMANDTLGNTAVSQVIRFTVDTTPPAVTVFSPQGENYAHPSIPFNCSASDALGSVHTVIAEVDSSYNITLNPSGAFYVSAPVVFGDGAHWVRIFANDTLGNTAVTYPVYFTVDTTAPWIGINYPENSSYPRSSVAVNAYISDYSSSVDVAIAEFDSSYNITLDFDGEFYICPSINLPDGPHSVRVIANDTLGNTASSTVYFTVDTTPPSIQINFPTAYPYYGSASLAINASASDLYSGVHKVIAELNGTMNFTMVPQGGFFVAEVVLTEGSYTLRIIANDTLGNTGQAEYAGRFYIDLSPPSIIVVSPENSSYPTGLITINASASDLYSGVHTVVAEVDGANNYTLSASSPYHSIKLDLEDGPHSIRVIANDTLGNTAVSQVIRFTVDTTPPAVTINMPAASASYASSLVVINATVVDSLSPVHTVVAEVGGQNITLSPSGSEYVGSCTLADGIYTLRIIANDTLGNTNSAESVNFKVDTTPPSISLISPENSSYASTPAIKAFASDPSGVHKVLAEVDSSYNVTLDFDGEFYICPSIALPDGPHSIRVIANDTLGNTASASSQFLVDTTPPAVTITSPSTSSCLNTGSVRISATFSDTTSKATVVSVLLDGSEAISKASINGSTLTLEATLNDGQHALSVTVEDDLGNTASASTSFCVDTRPPYLALSSHEDRCFVGDADLDLYFLFIDETSGIDLSTARASIDGAPVDPLLQGGSAKCNLSISATLGEGEHLVEVSIADAAGNRASVALRLTVDLSPPRVYDLQPPNVSAIRELTAISAEFSDLCGVVPTSVSILVDGADVTQISSISASGFSLSIQLQEGSHSVSVAVSDLVGNTGLTVWSFTVDATPPSIIVISPSNNTSTNNARLPFSFSFHDSNSGINSSSVSLLVDGADVTSYANVSSSALSYVPPLPLADGDHVIVLAVSDCAGNAKSATVLVSVDTVPPEPPVSPIQNSSTLPPGPFQFNASLPDGAVPSSLKLYIDGTDCTSNATIADGRVYCTIDLPGGAHSIRLEVQDASGNAASSTWIVNVASAGQEQGDIGWLLLVVAVLAVAAVLAAAFLRKRGRK
ncbi:MAG: Ig-like domain-containing protein [Candidatus Methanosuratincola petrocarbonis]